MFNRFRRCQCMNNNTSITNKDLLETSCQNIYNYDYNEDTCECGFDNYFKNDVFPQNPMLGQSYVPLQFADETFKPHVGLRMGTIYPELVSPYSPCQSMREIDFIRSKNELGEGCNNGTR